jgi:7-carboxy-7-deazaguanine synthase
MPAEMKPLQITEIFRSIQGESTYAGLPCVFIRLSGCNLRCPWCDTRYSYEPGPEMTVGEVVSAVNALQDGGLVEITGGEPLLQEAAPKLARVLLDAGYSVLVETNGTVSIDMLPEKLVRIVDVKCPSSGGSFLESNLVHLRPSRDQIKFVIADRVDYEYAVEFAKNRLPSGLDVLFSAVSDRLPLDCLAGWMLDDRLPWRLQLQLHKIIWDPQIRGV